MKIRTFAALAALLCLAAPSAFAQTSPTCVAPEAKVSWPAANPVWEFCWLRPSQSSAPRGSGMELRNVYYRGRLVLKAAHAPMLFAEYQSSTCYRDWKDTNSGLIGENAIRNQLGTSSAFNATTSCDRSSDPVQSYGLCPFQLPGRTAADCFTGVAIEDRGDHLLLTTQYSADWYLYASRFRFFPDGSFSPEFGFGNRDGTGNGTTHWHHNYWRLDFDIEGSTNDVIEEAGVVQSSEFATLRCNGSTTPSCGTERTWTVRDTVTNRGYRLMPGANDYLTPTNQSGRNFHLRDVLGTIYKANEYGDNPNYSLSDCAMNHGNLANSEDLDGATGAGTDVVLWYRAGVRDLSGTNSMVCKSVAPVFVPVGDWTTAEGLFANGFEP
jgi:hypothetical protein